MPTSDRETPHSTQSSRHHLASSIPEQAVQPVDRLMSLLLGGFEQGLGAYNAQIFASFVLSGCTMYLLARYVTGSPLAALIAGFAFTFSPFHLSVAMQYNALGSIQWIPLYILALLVLLRRGRLQRCSAGGRSVRADHGHVVLLRVVRRLVHRARRRLLRAGHCNPAAEGQAPLASAARRFVTLAATRGAVGVAVIVVLAGPLLIPSAQGAADAGSEAIEHPINEAVRYSARPWMFFVPPHDNPVVGDRLRPWIVQRIHDAPLYEQAVYLGYALMLLALLAFLPIRRLGPLGERARFARGPLLAGAIVGLVMAIGPYIPLDGDYWRRWQTPEDTSHVPSLSWVMFQLAPVFRFFTRAFVLTSACLAVLAAIGFSRLERWPRLTLPWRAALAALAIGLIGLEYSNAPPHVWFSAKQPQWVEAVRRVPAGSNIVQYPLAGGILTAFSLLHVLADEASSPNTEPARATGSCRTGRDSRRARRSPRRRGASPCRNRLRRRPHRAATADDGSLPADVPRRRHAARCRLDEPLVGGRRANSGCRDLPRAFEAACGDARACAPGQWVRRPRARRTLRGALARADTGELVVFVTGEGPPGDDRAHDQLVLATSSRQR